MDKEKEDQKLVDKEKEQKPNFKKFNKYHPPDKLLLYVYQIQEQEKTFPLKQRNMDFFTDQVKKKFSDKKPESSDPEPNHNKNKPGHTEPTTHKPGHGEPTTHKPVSNTDPTTHRPATNAELMASAKIVAEAAQAAARHESDKLDKAKVAGATADILDAASRYGKLDEKSGVGQYLEKAEQYLHKYETSHSHSSTGGTGSHGNVGGHGGGAGAPAAKKEDEKSGGGHGFGDYAKMAQGFMK